MAAYLLLFVTFTLGLIGVLVKTSREGKNGSSENELTNGGWVVLGLMIVSCGLSIVVQSENDAENENLRNSLQTSNNELQEIGIKNDTIQELQRTLARATSAIETSTIALRKTSSKNVLLTRRIMKDQEAEIARAKQDNLDLKQKLDDQKRRMVQLSQPINIVRVRYMIEIDGAQLAIISYRNRLIRSGLTFNEQQNLLRSGHLPDSRQSNEEEFPEFLKALNGELFFTSMSEYKPGNSLAVATQTNIYREDSETTNSSLKFDASKGSFFLTVEANTHLSTNKSDMIGLIDFSERYVFFELVNGTPSVAYRMMRLVLTNIDGRTLQVDNFEQVVSKDGQKRFRSKIIDAVFR